MNNTLEAIVAGINNGVYKQIIILSGAGISTNSGIPDYRSPKGIFAQLATSDEYPDAKNPTDFFSRHFVDQHPELKNHPLVKQFHQQIVDAQPTASHYFAKWLHDRGILRRVFTQNVDGLYQKTGLSDSVLVEYHGNYTKGTIVLYGDDIPVEANLQAERDLVDADLLIVMGSSLQVAPFCALPNMTSKKCTRVLVDLYPRNAMTNRWSKRQGPMSLYTEPVLSSVEFSGRDVTLRSLWRDHKKYPKQYIYTADCDDWANAVMDNCKTDKFTCIRNEIIDIF